MFNKPTDSLLLRRLVVFTTSEVGSLNKSSSFAPALGVIKITNVRDSFGHTVMILKSDIDVQQTHR